MGNSISGKSDDFSKVVEQYAHLQGKAYKDQSASKEDIEQLKATFTAYLDGHEDANAAKIKKDLDHMANWIDQHTATHNNNDEWDETRTEMDGFIKEMAPEGVSTAAIDAIPHGGGSSSGASGNGATGVAATGGTANYTVTGAGQGDGSGAGLNYNNPNNSKEYKGLTIDQMLAQKSPLGDAMRKHPDIVKEIKDASARTGVPAGLMAATAFRESTFGEDKSSSVDSGGALSEGVFQGGQIEMDTFNRGGNLNNLHDNVTMFANFMAEKYKDCGSWGGALRYWNSGNWDKGTPLPNPNDLSVIRGKDGISPYVSQILGDICFKGSYHGSDNG